MFRKDGKSNEHNSSSHYSISSTRRVKRKELTPEIEAKELEEGSKTTLKASSLPPDTIPSASSSKTIIRFNSLSPQDSSLCSATPLTSRKSGDSNTLLPDSPGCSSSELSDDIMLPPHLKRSPLRLKSKNSDPETEFKIILYLIRCFYDRQQIQRFFDSDQFIGPEITNEDKDVFFQILLAQLTPEQAHTLKHRQYIETRLMNGDAGDTKPYLEALITGKNVLSSPFSDNLLLKIKTTYLLQSLCNSYLFFEFIFSANSDDRIDNEIFTLFKNFNLEKTEATSLCAHIIQFLHVKKELHILSLEAMCTLINLVNELLEAPEKIDDLLNALISTHEGHHLLRTMNTHHVLKLTDFLKRTEKMKLFFSKIIDIFESATVVNSSEISDSELKQEIPLPTVSGKLTYFIQHLPNSNFIDQMLICSPQPEKMRFLKVLWDLNLLPTDTLIFKKIGLIHRLKETQKEEEIVKRLKRWFSVNSLTDSPEIQRAFMCNEDLIKNNKKKLQAYQSLIISAEQAEMIQNLRHSIALNELKAEWVTYFRAIWALLLEHWDPRAHLLCAMPLRDSFRKVMLERLESYQEDAYNSAFYQLPHLPAEMTSEILQNSALVEKYQTYLDKMAACYEQIMLCRKRNEKALTAPFPKLKGYASFQEMFSIFIPSLSKEQASTLSKEFTQLFVKISVDDAGLATNWPEKAQGKSPEMLYISTHLSQKFIEILSTTKAFKLSMAGCYLQKKHAKQAILEFYKMAPLIEQSSLSSDSIEGYGLKCDVSIPDTSPQKEEKLKMNSPSSFFTHSQSGNSKIAQGASSSHHVSYNCGIPLTPRRPRDFDTISSPISGLTSTKSSSGYSTLSISPRK